MSDESTQSNTPAPPSDAHKRVVLIAGAMVVLVASAALLRSQSGTAAAPETPSVLIEDLAARAADITSIEISADSGTLELVRTHGRWTLPALDGYPADIAAVRTLVAGLESLEIAEKKTANPANHERLGLDTPEPPAAPAADTEPEPSLTNAPMRVRLLAGDGSAIADVILGNRSPAGVFVRTADADQTWLARSAPDVLPDAETWFDQRPVRVERGDVRTVTVEHADGEVVRIVPNDDDGFELAELPEGTQPIGPWQAGQVAGALGFLTVEDVRAADAIGFADAAATTITFELEPEPAADPTASESAEAPTLVARVAEIDGRSWATFEAGGPGADEVNAITGGWAYAIGSFTRDALVKRTADLVEPVEALPEDAVGPVAPFEVPAEIPPALSPPSDD